MKPDMKKTAALLAALLFSTSAEAADHKNIRIGISQYPSTLHPMFDDMVAKSYVLGMAERPVTAHDASWKPICLLCTELPSFANKRAKKETLPNGKTGIAATYTIKPDAAWGDGTPVTTKDILFAWDVGRNPQSGVGNAEFFAKDIAAVTADDDKTFTIHFSKEQCDFAAINDFYPLPAQLEKEIFDKDPKTYQNRTLYVTAPATAGLYWGPYKVSKVDNGAAITLDRNPNWHGQQAAFDSVTVKAIENSAALSANLLSGDVDYIAGELGISLDQAIPFQKRLPAGFTAIYKPGLTYEHIDLKLDQPAFKDARVRQALMYGMNRAAINQSLFAGKQPLAVTDINPLDTVYNKNAPAYAYDPVQAEKLLDDAGYKKGADGLRGLSFTFSTTAGNKSREVIEQAIQSDWKKLGIIAKIDNQPARVLFGDTMRLRKFTGAVMYAWMSAPKSIPKTTLYSAMIPTEKNNHAGQNYAGYANPRVDKIIDDLEVVCAPKDNQKLWDELQVIYAKDLPALPLYYKVDAYFIPGWLKGVTPTGHQYPTTLWIENWQVAP